MRHDKYVLVGKKAVPFIGDNIDTEEGRRRLAEWAEKSFGDKANRRVGRDVIGQYLISTVFLGLNHNFGSGPPLLFETMVFDDNKDGSDVYMERCSTWDEAEAMHKKAVELCRSGGIEAERYDRD